MWQKSVRLPNNWTASSDHVYRVSNIFQPAILPQKDEKIKIEELTSKSQKLMLDVGVIRQASSGSFHLLPLGFRALEKLVRLVDREMLSIGAQKMIFPTLTNANLWKATGRFEAAGSELFTLKDRHNHTYILSPTHEEAAAQLLATVSPISYKELPLKLYQITSKFRDEIKPRFGLMRSREFIMKDLYTFDADLESAENTYHEVNECYNRIFTNIGVPFIKVLGTSGMMGGSLSHEFHYQAAIGEDRLLICADCQYSGNSELSDIAKCPNCGKISNLQLTPAIEVGHTFLLGPKYSNTLKANCLSPKGKQECLQMGSYGLGLSRILAATLEVLSNEQELRWPRSLVPFSVIVIPPKKGSKEESSIGGLSEQLYSSLQSISVLENNVVLDDRTDMTIGRRMLDSKRVGYPFVIVIGSKATSKEPLFELNDVEEKTRLFLNQGDLLTYLTNKLK